MKLFTTGQAARILDATEPQVGETVRRGKIVPKPAILSGRRLWTPDQLVMAAEVLGKDRVAVLRRMTEEVRRVS